MAAEESKSWIDKRTRLEKIFFVIFLIILIVFVIFLIALNCESTGGCGVEKETKVCSTQGCLKAAVNILESIDTSVMPCDDFYQFACGNRLKKYQIPEDKEYLDVFSIIEDDVEIQLRDVLSTPIKKEENRWETLAKQFYKACMNKDLINQKGKKLFQDFLKDLGGWPVLEGEEWNETQFNWMDLMAEFRKKGLGTGYFIEFSVSIDGKNSSIRTIELDQPSNFGLAKEFLISNKYVDIYYKLMVNMAVLLGANRSVAESELKDSLAFETELAKLALPNEKRRNYTQLYNPMTIKELQNNYNDAGDWLNYINRLLPAEVQQQENDKIVVVVPSYISGFEQLISNYSNRTQANYAFWRVIQELTDYASDDIYEYILVALHEISQQETKKPPRWKKCVKETSSQLSYAVASMYIQKYFDEDARKNVELISDHILKTFKSSLENLEWMDNNTRQEALGKANKLGQHIGYPDELKNYTILDEYYKEFNVNENEYLYSVLNLQKHATDLAYKELNEPVDRNDWKNRAKSYDVGAYYSPSQNNIKLQAGILQGLFFNKDRPNYLNFGAIGSITAHEITHGFDDKGRQLDQFGNLKDWWESSTTTKFLDKVQCIIDQYSNYTVKDINKNINGKLTQGENIADNGGIKFAYLAYKTYTEEKGEEDKIISLKYTPNQLFWISAAMNWCTKYQKQYLEIVVASDTHSPNQFRVLGPFSNSDEFAKDFNCEVGSPMNPVKKCAVW